MSYLDIGTGGGGTVINGIDDIQAVVDGSSAGAGEIGEIIEDEVSSATGVGVGADNVWGSVTSITLTAGEWIIDGLVGFSENGATLEDAYDCAITDSASPTPAFGEYARYNHLVTSTADLIAPAPVQIVSLTSTADYYLNTRFNYSAGSPEHYGRIRARRYR